MDLREFLFRPFEGRLFRFTIKSRERGILSSEAALRERSAEIGLEIVSLLPEGSALLPGTKVLEAFGSAEKVVRAEEILLGAVGKPSGVATSAAAIVARAGHTKVVCGAWKKVSPAVRAELRQAIATGGVGIRITDRPFVYLDKNYIRMFGNVSRAVKRAKSFDPVRLVAVQLRGEGQPIAVEASAAAACGAEIVMIDTGCLEDLLVVKKAVETGRWRDQVKLAFGGGVTLENVAEVAAAGADIVDVGRAIIDAPLLDFSLDVEG